jgi:hypothetical protein
MAAEENKLELLKRRPSDLVRYITWSRRINDEWGSTSNFVLKKRLRWEYIKSPDGPQFEIEDSTPFANSADYTILWNDWPYGLTPDISHIIVWLKTPIAVSKEDGSITEESRQLIEAFMDNTFGTPMRKEIGEDRVLWFKNQWRLQSVRSLEHVHVLVRDAPQHLIHEWTQEHQVEKEK